MARSVGVCGVHYILYIASHACVAESLMFMCLQENSSMLMVNSSHCEHNKVGW